MKYETFEIGEVVILQNIVGANSYLNSTETTIVSKYPAGTMKYNDTGEIINEVSYEIDIKLKINTKTLCEAKYLRKKRPPFKGEEIIRQMFINPSVNILEKENV